MSPRKRGEHPSRNSRRRRPLKQTILIVCEGKETERNYFEALKKQDRFTENYTITVKKGKGGSREQIAKHAVKRKTTTMRITTRSGA